MKRVGLTLLLLVLMLAPLSGPAAATRDALYSATVIVTGRENLAERARGFREALAEVLMKLAADRRVVDGAVAVQALEMADDFVSSFGYVDRKFGVGISDEQGTRDRSFLLAVRFADAEVDALLGQLGARPWKDERPVVKVELSVTDAGGSFEVTRTSERGYGQRQVLEAEAERAGLPLLLAGETATRGGEAEAVLFGRMTLTPTGHWDTVWTLAKGNFDQRWTVDDATFDRAIEDGVWRTAAELKALAE